MIIKITFQEAKENINDDFFNDGDCGECNRPLGNEVYLIDRDDFDIARCPAFCSEQHAIDYLDSVL